VPPRKSTPKLPLGLVVNVNTEVRVGVAIEVGESEAKGDKVRVDWIEKVRVCMGVEEGECVALNTVEDGETEEDAEEVTLRVARMERDATVENVASALGERLGVAVSNRSPGERVCNGVTLLPAEKDPEDVAQDEGETVETREMVPGIEIDEVSVIMGVGEGDKEAVWLPTLLVAEKVAKVE